MSAVSHKKFGVCESKKIIFAGHFAIGERSNVVQKNTIEQAKKMDGDLAILVNDLDVKRKILYYQIGGREMLIKYCGRRKRCGVTQPLCELPEFDELPKIIDWDFYESALRKIIELNSKEEIDELLREKIISDYVQKRLEYYKLDSSQVLILTERRLRNIAGTRMSNSGRNKKSSWLSLFEKAGVVDEVQAHVSKIPICVGLSVALYETAVKAGYEYLVELAETRDKKSVEKGFALYASLHDNFPDDPRWKLKIENYFFSS